MDNNRLMDTAARSMERHMENLEQAQLSGLTQEELKRWEACNRIMANANKRVMQMANEIRKEQAAQRARMDKIEKEQRRQAELLEKMEYQFTAAKKEVEHYKPLLERLTQEITDLDNKIWYYEQRGLPCTAMKDKLFKLEEKRFGLERKLDKAQFNMQFAANRLAS